jgi:hypothetical protein
MPGRMAKRASPERLDDVVHAGRQVPMVRLEAGVGNTGFAGLPRGACDGLPERPHAAVAGTVTLPVAGRPTHIAP